MPFRIKVFKSAKQGRPITECADAFAIASHAGMPNGVIALADGATEALLSGDFANELCGAYIQAPDTPFDAESLTAWAEPLATDFHARLLKWAYGKQEEADANWVFPMKAEDEGSLATFLAARLEEPHGDQEANWQAVAVGDCCISRWRDGKLQQASWPIEKPEHFGTTPGGISSRVMISGQVLTGPDESGPSRWRRGDLIVMATDAVAEWILLFGEEQDLPKWFDWSYEEYDNWLEGERNAVPRRIKDDDSTLILVQWAETGEIQISEQPLPKVEEILLTTQENAPSEEIPDSQDDTDETHTEDSSASLPDAPAPDTAEQGDPLPTPSSEEGAANSEGAPAAAAQDDPQLVPEHDGSPIGRPGEDAVTTPSVDTVGTPPASVNHQIQPLSPPEGVVASARPGQPYSATHHVPTISPMPPSQCSDTTARDRRFTLIEQCLLLPWPVSALWYLFKKKSLQPDQ